MSDKIIKIETRIAFQEQSFDDLNKVVIEQGKRIDLLENKVASLLDLFNSAKLAEDEIIDKRPPHY